MTKLYSTRQLRKHSARSCLRPGIHNIPQPFYRQHSLLGLLPHGGQSQQWLTPLSSQHLKGNKLAYSQPAIHNHMTSHQKYQQGGKTLHCRSTCINQHPQLETAKASAKAGRQQLLPLIDKTMLQSQSLYGLYPCNSFHQKGITAGTCLPIFLQSLTIYRRNQYILHQIQRQCQ